MKCNIDFYAYSSSALDLLYGIYRGWLVSPCIHCGDSNNQPSPSISRILGWTYHSFGGCVLLFHTWTGLIHNDSRESSQAELERRVMAVGELTGGDDQLIIFFPYILSALNSFRDVGHMNMTDVSSLAGAGR